MLIIGQGAGFISDAVGKRFFLRETVDVRFPVGKKCFFLRSDVLDSYYGRGAYSISVGVHFFSRLREHSGVGWRWIRDAETFF